jgi:hypothetical protein
MRFPNAAFTREPMLTVCVGPIEGICGRVKYSICDNAGSEKSQ